MGRNNELNEINIKNYMCYYFNDIIKALGVDLMKLYEKSFKNILVYNIWRKILI